MKKLTACLIGLSKISLVCLIFFVLSPSLKAQAMFNDTANINMGIKLELGTVSLATKDTTIVNAASFTEGDPVLIASSNLINDGSLSGKLGYKIDIAKENGSPLTTEELKVTSIIINFGNVAKEVSATAASLNTNFTFAKDANNKDVIIDPNKAANVPVSVKYKSSIPTKEQKLTIKVTFRLIQSNTGNPNAEMFSDEKSLTNTVTLVPKVIKEESYWPNKSTFVNAVHGNYTYSVEKMKMLFSETVESFNSQTRQIKNLNKAKLYIQLPKSEPLTKTITKDNGKKETKEMFIVSKLTTDEAAIKVESIELNEEHHGIIITFKLEDKYVYNSSNPDVLLDKSNKDRYALSLNVEIQKYGMYDSNEYHYYDNSHNYDHFFATRLVLNTDIPTVASNYAQLSIKLTDVERRLSIKHLYTNSAPYVRPEDFKEVQLKKELINIDITGTSSNLVSSKVNTDKTFILWLFPNQKITNAILNVKITGDTGHALLISRKLENGTNSRSMNMRSMEAPLVEEIEQPVELPLDTEMHEEKPTSTTDTSLPNEQTPEVPIEEVVEENPIGELEEAVEEEPIEGVDSKIVESDPELKEESITKEDSTQAVPKEQILGE